MFENKALKVNISDYAKVFAVTAVIMQTILSYALGMAHTQTSQTLIATAYILVKFTAPLFIFAIVYNMVKTSEHVSYFEFLKDKFFELVIPYVLWTTAYLVVFPKVQQHVPFNSVGSFLLKYLTGDGAPHLWYTVMMLQIQLFMPFFVWLGYKYFKNKRVVVPTLISATAVYVAWYLFYMHLVILNPHGQAWYLLDRFVASFIIYGIYGVAALMYHETLYQLLYKIRYAFLPIGLVVAGISIQHLLTMPGLINLAHAPYLNTVQSLYSLIVILAVFMYGSVQIKNNVPKLPMIKWLSTYAYRTYLANVFVFQVLLKIFGNFWVHLPIVAMVLVAYLMTVSCSFLIAYLLHYLYVGAKSVFQLKRKQIV